MSKVKTKSKLTYKRILLKMSGEVFKGAKQSGVDYDVILDLARRVKKVRDMGVEIGIVIGGGNIWRYRDNKSSKGPSLDRVTSDTIGMMATNMNGLAFAEALNAVGCEAIALTAFPSEKAMKTYTPRLGRKYLKKGYVTVFAGGTGSPFFTTDTAAAIRALETRCDVVFKATKVDYVYDKDPVKHKNAKKYTQLTYDEMLDQKLGVMDMTCAALCKEGGLPMLVFNLNTKGLIAKAVKGKKVGTLITI